MVEVSEGAKMALMGRFAVANVEDEVVLKLGPRLRKMNDLMGMER